MAIITTLNPNDNWAVSRVTINDNFSNINTEIWNIVNDISQVSQIIYVDDTNWDDTGWNGNINAPFKTITQALTDITDSSSTKKYSINVYPWTYTADITMKDFVSIESAWVWVIQTWKIICNWTNFFLNIQLVRAPTLTETFIDMTTNNSTVAFDFCLLQNGTSTDNIQPTLIESDWTSTYVLTDSDIVYTNLSTWVNNISTSVLKHTWTWAIVMNWNTFFIDTLQTWSGNIEVFDDSSTWIISINSLLLLGNELTAWYTGEIIWIHSKASWNKFYHNYQSIMTWTWSSTWTAIKTSWWVSQWIRVQGWSSSITWFANNQYTDIWVTDILDSFFNTILPNMTNVWAWTLKKVDSIWWDLRINTALIDETLLLWTPTNQSLEDIFNIWFNAGWVSWSEVTDNTDWSVTVALWTWLVRIANTDQAQLKSFDIAENTNVTLVDWASNIVYVDYNSWSPIYASTITRTDILDNENDKYEVAEIVREWTVLHISDLKQQARSQWQQRAYSLEPVARANNSWLIIWETWTRNITITSWAIWRKYSKIPLSALDTSVSDTFDSYYTTDSYTTWTKVSADTQWNNTQYNDITTWLVSISPSSKFSFQDFYLNWAWTLVRIYAPAQYNSLAEAEEAPTSPNLPIRLENNSILVWRITFQWNDATAQSILSAFDIIFSWTWVTDHWNLGWLADDDHTQYLNETRHDALASDNPHGVTSSQVGLWNVDNVADASQVSTWALNAWSITSWFWNIDNGVSSLDTWDIDAQKIDTDKWNDIASATTTDIWASTWNFVDITWTTTITWFGTVKAWTPRTLQFDWALILTYNATSLILPWNANITTVAWDTCDMISLWSGNWICTSYMREDWTALISAWWATTMFWWDWSDWNISWALTVTWSNDTYIVKNYDDFTPWSNTVTITPTNCILHLKIQGNCDLTNTTFSFAWKWGQWWAWWTTTAWNWNPWSNWGSWFFVNKINETIFGWAWGSGVEWEWTPQSNWGSAWSIVNSIKSEAVQLIRSYINSIWSGWAWGWAGWNDSNWGTPWAGWAGWDWGWCVILEVAWDLTFSSSTLNFNWTNWTAWSAAAAPWHNGWGWWGGWWGWGQFLCLYSWTLTWSNTPNVAWWSAGAWWAGAWFTAYNGWGWWGWGSSISWNWTAWSNCPNTNSNWGAGWAWATWLSIIEKNITFS